MLQKNYLMSKNREKLYTVTSYSGNPNIFWIFNAKMKRNTEIRRVIIGAFFGAIYSIVLVQPLILMTNNDSMTNSLLQNIVQILFYPLIIVIGYVIIDRSLSWKYSRNAAGSRIKRLLAHKIEVADILLLGALISVAIVLLKFNILNRIDAYMWILGVATILGLQFHSIPSLLDETN